MTSKLSGGDSFPSFPLSMVDGSVLTLPNQPTADYLVVLFYRGSFWPYCLRQLGGFSEQLDTLEQLGAKVIAATAEPLEKANEVAAKVSLSLPIAYGVTRDQATLLGSWWEDRRQIIQPSDFVLNDTGKVLSSTYSTGPIGRLEAADAIRFIQFQEKQKQAG